MDRREGEVDGGETGSEGEGRGFCWFYLTAVFSPPCTRDSPYLLLGFVSPARWWSHSEPGEGAVCLTEGGWREGCWGMPRQAWYGRVEVGGAGLGGLGGLGALGVGGVGREERPGAAAAAGRL